MCAVLQLSALRDISAFCMIKKKNVTKTNATIDSNMQQGRSLQLAQSKKISHERPHLVSSPECFSIQYTRSLCRAMR